VAASFADNKKNGAYNLRAVRILSMKKSCDHKKRDAHACSNLASARIVELQRPDGRPDRTVWSLLVCAVFLVGLVAALSVRGADFYLAQLGPPPLRFAATLKPYKLPPLARSRSVDTNAPIAPEPDAPSAAVTNATASVTSALPSEIPTHASTDAVTRGDTIVAEPQPLSEPPNPLLLNTNSIPAGNLLIVTPQVLADYFKANLDAISHAVSNGVTGGEIPFIPPIPRIMPSSEATYKVQ